MPSASLPTLSPTTVDTTAQAIGRYEAIVAGGGWPKVPPIDRLRLGNRHPSVVALRQWLMLVGKIGGILLGELSVQAGPGQFMRFHSSHCVRVQNVRALFDWLLRDTPGGSPL